MSTFFMTVSAYAPFITLIGLVITLLAVPRWGMAKPIVISSLVALSLSHEHVPEVLAKVGPNLITVLVMMTAVQLAVKMALDERGGDWLGAIISRVLYTPALVRVPASIIVPVIFMPLAMACASCIHNIPAVALLAPLAFTLCQRLGIAWLPTLVGLIPASNLGGASAAWGDTPAIIQRAVWKFDVATFAANMLPRNLVVLLMLTATIATWSYLTTRGTKKPGMELFARLRIRDLEKARPYRTSPWTAQQAVGAGGLVMLFLLQMLPPLQALGGSMAVLGVLLAFGTNDEFVRKTFALGDEAVLAISGLFVLAALVERSPVLATFVHDLLHGSGKVEITAFIVTSMISADGAAAMLASLVHTMHAGSLESAWALASGICAGSTALLTSASAGPVLIEASRRAGAPITFRAYAAFGLPFSLLMLSSYLVF